MNRRRKGQLNTLVVVLSFSVVTLELTPRAIFMADKQQFSLVRCNDG